MIYFRVDLLTEVMINKSKIICDVGNNKKKIRFGIFKGLDMMVRLSSSRREPKIEKILERTSNYKELVDIWTD